MTHFLFKLNLAYFKDLHRTFLPLTRSLTVRHKLCHNGSIDLIVWLGGQPGVLLGKLVDNVLQLQGLCWRMVFGLDNLANISVPKDKEKD